MSSDLVPGGCHNGQDIREGFERVFPMPLGVMVFRRDDGSNLGWGEKRENR